MIITIQTAQFFISVISLILAYFVVTTASNVFKAWYAMQLGDDTPALLGLLDWNPLVHLDIIGFALIPFFKFGWGKYVPINPANIRGSWRGIKTTTAFLANSVALVFIALFALIALMILFDPKIIDLTRFMILYESVSYRIIAASYPDHSSVSIVIGTILVCIMYLSVVLSVLQGLINGITAMVIINSHAFKHKNLDQVVLFGLIALFIVLPLLGILDIVTVLRIVVMQIIATAGHAISHFF